MKKIIYLCFLCTISLKAQTVPVGSIDNNLAEQRSRNEQLLGKTDSLVSFTLRPLNLSLIDTTEATETKKTALKVLPITTIQQFNTYAPSGWNDGNMIPARGYQTMISAGIYTKFHFISAQFRPEYVFADNKNYQIFPSDTAYYITNDVRRIYASYLNTTDIPTPYGENKYSRFNWGQSNIKINYKGISLGASTENLWWGPGQRNSIIMSNNAQGFLHFTFNSNKPLKTPIGSFEFQVISGKLENSGIKSPKSLFIIDGVDYEVEKNNSWRYINGLSFNYHPKWIPGLFLGFNRTIQVYKSDMGSSFRDYFPIFLPAIKESLDGSFAEEDAKGRDQLASVFFRWFMKEAKFEFYGEYAKNDYEADKTDFFLAFEHSRAYLIGFNKILKLNADKYLKLTSEITQMDQTTDRLPRPAGAFYQHSVIFQGYTHKGEVLGAGIGPGGNLITLDFSFWDNNKMWGIQMERYQHNMDFFYDAFSAPNETGYGSYNIKWVDFMFNAHVYHKFDKLSLMGKINYTKMFNYQWMPWLDKNIQFQITAQYKF